MAARDYFAHDNPEGVGGMYLIPKYLANTTYIGENLAICMEGDRSDAAYKGWFESPTHYDNMVSPDYTLYGIGTAWDNEKNCTVFVNHFAGV